jgi:capsular polysaccharide biosynthesis protein
MNEEPPTNSAPPQSSPGTAVPGWFVPVFPGATRFTETLSISSLMRRQWLLLVIVPTIFVVSAAAFVQMATPVYEARVVIAPMREENNSGLFRSLTGQFRGLAPTLGLDIGGTTLTDRALATMRSKTFSVEFLRERQFVPALFPERWDSSRNVWRDRAPSTDQIFERFDRRVRFISVDRATGFVQVAIRLPDREATALWAEQFIEQINEKIRLQAAEEATRNLNYLNRELRNEHPLGVRNALFELVESQIREQMLASVRRDFAYRVVDPPTVPDSDRPVSPKRALSISLALLAGVLLATLAAVIRERSNAN